MDSTLSASELRSRHHKGGSYSDAQLSASQLRARHGVPHNSGGWSTSGGDGDSSTTLLLGLVAVVAIGALAYFLL